MPRSQFSRRPPNTQAIRRSLLMWAEGHLRDFPWRRPGTTLYGVLVAEILLKRTTARAVARAYCSFIDQFPNLDSLVLADYERLESVLRPLGLYRQRAKGLKEMAQFLVTEYEGLVPRDIDALSRIPQVGPYAARALVSFGHGFPAAVVDSNVVRVLSRLFRERLTPAETLEKYQEIADVLLDKANHQKFNWALLDLGSLVCRYDMPKCHECPLARYCEHAILVSQGHN